MLRRAALPAAVAAFAVALSSCINPNRTVDACSVTVAPAQVSIPVNGSQQLVGTAFDCNGNTIRGKKISYASDNVTVATVTPEGTVIGVAVGVTTVQASANGKSASAQVTVRPEAVASVQVTPSAFTLRKTQVRQFTAVARNSSGVVVEGRTFQWSSSNASVASVDQNGLVTALTPGSVVIAASSDQASGTAALQVTEIPIGSCALAPQQQTLLVGQQSQPTVTLRDTANGPLPTQGRTMAWSSANQVVASVSQTGVVTALSQGTTTITAAAPENAAVNCGAEVTVVRPRVASVVVTPRTGQLRLGIPRQFAVTLLDSVGQTIPPGRVITWSTLAPTVATVSQTGIVTGQALGQARIVATSEGVADTVQLPVTRIPVGTVTVSPLQASVFQGGTTQFTATVEDSVGTVVTDRVVEWQSGNLAIATVSPTGLATGVSPGATLIAASSEGKGAQASIIVQLVPADSIVVNDTTFSVTRGTNGIFSIRVQDANGNQLLGRAVLVTSSTANVATGVANQAGTLVTVSGITAGETVLSLQVFNNAGQAEGKVSRVRVTVTPP
jgi:uncharacterized protein YjdB